MKILDKSLEILGLLLFILYIGLYGCFGVLLASTKSNQTRAGMMVGELVKIMPVMGIIAITVIALFVFAQLKNRIARSVVVCVLAAVQILTILRVPDTIELAEKYLRKGDTEWMNACNNVKSLVDIIMVMCIIIILVSVTLFMAVKSKKLPAFDHKQVNECNEQEKQVLVKEKMLRYIMVVFNVILAIGMSVLLMDGYGENYAYESTMSPATIIAAIEAPLVMFLLFGINGWILDGKNIKAIIGYFVYMALVRGGVEMIYLDEKWYYYQMDMWSFNNGKVFTLPLFGNVDRYMLLVYVVLGIFAITLAWNAGVREGIQKETTN